MGKNFEVHASNIANCVRLAGGSSAGILLYRIHVRSSKSTMKCRNGETGWAVLIPDQWVLDTGLTRRQYDKALRLLKDKNLIIYKNQQVGKGSGAPPLWAKISSEICVIIQYHQLPIGNWVNTPKVVRKGSSNHPRVSPIYNSVNSKHVNKDCKELRSVYIKDSNIINLGDTMKKGAGKGREVLANKKNKSIQDTIDSFKEKKRDEKITGVQSFEFFWINLYTEVYDDTIERWTAKEQGYARSILKKAKIRKKFNLAKVIKEVLENWDDYADFASAQRGQDKPPFYPSIGYIAAGFQDLVYWYKDHTKVVHSSAKDEDGMLTIEETMKEKE